MFGVVAHNGIKVPNQPPHQAQKISALTITITQPTVYKDPRGHNSQGRGTELVIQILGCRMYSVLGMKWAKKGSTSNEHVQAAAGTRW